MTVDSLVFPVWWGFRNQKITSCTLIAKTSSTKDFHLTNILCRWSLLKCVFNRIESCTKKKSNYYFLIYQWMFLPFRFDGGKNRHRGQISSLQTCCVVYLSYTAIQPSSKLNVWALPADVCLSPCNKWDERNDGRSPQFSMLESNNNGIFCRLKWTQVPCPKRLSRSQDLLFQVVWERERLRLTIMSLLSLWITINQMKCCHSFLQPLDWLIV